MWDDPVVQEVRKMREEHAARFDFNLQAIAEDLKKQQKHGSVKYVTLPSKKPIALPKIDSRKDAK